MIELPQADVPRFLRPTAAVLGILDLGSGSALAVAPRHALSLVALSAPSEANLVYLRMTGVYVGALGLAYLLAARSSERTRLKHMLEFALPFRALVGVFSCVALAQGWLPPIWIVVAVANVTLAGAQTWLLRRLG